jgi:Na+-driven multidrug efflux pump
MGAGLATGIASVASVSVGMFWCLSGRTYLTLTLRGFHFKKKEVSDIMYVGVPKSMETVLMASMSLIQRIFVIACGGVAGAMFFNIPWRYVSLACVISMAVSAALVPVCSAALGARDTAKAEAGYRYSLKITFISMAVISVICFVFADYLMLPFTYSPSMAELRPEFVHVLRIYAPIIVCMGMIDVGSAILQSLRKAQVSMYSTFFRNLLLIAVLYIASGISMDAIYYGLFLCEIVGVVIMLYPAYLAMRNYKRLNPPMEASDAVRSRIDDSDGSRRLPAVRGQHPADRVLGSITGGEGAGDRVRVRRGVHPLRQERVLGGVRRHQPEGGGARPQERGAERFGDQGGAHRRLLGYRR